MEQPAHNAFYCAIRTTFYAFALSCLCGCASKQTYSGRVVDAETGQPIVGAEISATYYERGKFAPSLDGCFLRIPVQASAVTDANGEFSLQVGRHHLDFWVSGPADSRSYRHSVRWWRVDEHHPDTLCIPLGKTGE